MYISLYIYRHINGFSHIILIAEKGEDLKGSGVVRGDWRTLRIMGLTSLFILPRLFLKVCVQSTWKEVRLSG